MIFPHKNSNAPRSRALWLGLALAVLVVLVYLPALRGGFIWDDDSHLTENAAIVGTAGFWSIWTTSTAVYYPLVLTVFWGLHALFGLNPLPYHLFTVLMHAACAVALWRVLRALRVPGAWLGAALWALHPVMVESVAWITELKNTQSGFFYLLSILWFVKGEERELSERKRWPRYGWALLFFALAITSKASTVMLPVVLALCVWWRDGRWERRHLAALAPFFLLSLAASAWTIWEQRYHSGAVGVEWEQTWPERLIVAGRAVWFYLGKLAWPHPLIFIYPRWRIDAGQPLAYLPGLAVVGVFALLWVKRVAWGRGPLFVWAYFTASLFPALDFFNVYFFRYSFVGDHFQHLASMGPLALAGAALELGMRRFQPEKRWLTPALGGILLAVLAVLTWRQVPVYASPMALWNDTISKDPDCWMAHNNMGSILEREGKLEEAMGHYRTALRVYPGLAGHHNNVGNLLFLLGRPKEGMVELQEALRLDPKMIDALNNVGNTLLKEGKLAEAVEKYREAVRLGPAIVDSRNNLGVGLVALGRFEEALEQYGIGVELAPKDARLRHNAGLALAKLKRWEDAVGQYRQAVELKPDYFNAWFHLGDSLESAGRLGEALEAYRKAAAVDPRSAQAHYELGRLLRTTGQPERALAEYREAQKLLPDQPLTLNDLAWIFATAADPKLRSASEAVTLAERAARLTEYKAATFLDTLAAAYAEAGRFPEAVKWARAAKEGAKGDAALESEIALHLASYERHEPWREKQGPSAP